MGGIMDRVSQIRPYTMTIGLRQEEHDFLESEARRLGVARTEVLRKACPEVFTKTGAKKGRCAGVSPWKLERRRMNEIA
jgi:hypothetical protein